MFSIALMMKHVEAFEHWKGNKSFTQHDAIKELLSMTEEIQEKQIDHPSISIAEVHK